MLCEKCGQNQATVRFVKVENGHKTEVNLCQSCAQGYSSGFAAGFNIQNILANLFDAPQVWVKVAPPDQRRCPTCGSSLGDIQKRAQLGCSDCYTIFQPEIDGILRRIHSTNQHVGKIPVTGYTKFRIQREIEDKRRELEECVRAERFEKAAELRDQVRELERLLAAEGESGK
jgi:protein arginine kinase activator